RIPGRLRLFGNRGVSGIDGNLSTAFGIAAARGTAVAVIGDLALLHDLNALALGSTHRLVVVVVDNGGGGIFDHLPQAGLPEFQEAWLAPQSLSPADATRAFGLDYIGAGGVGAAVAAVQAALERPVSTLVHIAIDRAVSLDRCRQFHSLYDQGASVHDPVAAFPRR
ncbi:MAG TPA: thiamine pyrophosphate-dependent enzyme, partial [Magnetospirillum sp.]|nr:thiamine pyrophosphate-dependent enzyme [Magnetospirillum sp.]